MMTFDEFEEYLYQVSEEIPDQFYIDLNGGIMAREHCKIHPRSVGDELSIMGEYHVEGALGRYIVLYYGSFVRQFERMPDEFWKDEIRKVLEHELTHHLESLAGEKDLEIEDEVRLMEYLHSKRSCD